VLQSPQSPQLEQEREADHRCPRAWVSLSLSLLSLSQPRKLQQPRCLLARLLLAPGISFLSSDPDARVACNACPPRHVIFGQARPPAPDAPPAAS
jgi:hypothetical protein